MCNSQRVGYGKKKEWEKEGLKGKLMRVNRKILPRGAALSQNLREINFDRLVTRLMMESLKREKI